MDHEPVVFAGGPLIAPNALPAMTRWELAADHHAAGGPFHGVDSRSA